MKKEKTSLIAACLLQLNLMLKSKKGLWSLEEFIKIGLVAFIFFFTLLFATKLHAAVFGDKDDGSSANFDRIASKMQELLNNNRKLDYSEINYYLGDGRAVVGYNKAWNSETNLPIIGLKIEKPGFCGDKSCLCFFKGDSVLSGKPNKPCIKFDKVTYLIKDKDAAIAYSTERTVNANIFYRQPMSDAFTKDEYKYLLIDGAYLKAKDQVIYIEKYENQLGEVIFYIAPVNDATRDKIKQRKQYIDNENKQ